MALDDVEEVVSVAQVGLLLGLKSRISYFYTPIQAVYKYTMGLTMRSASIRSRIPPCPGTIHPESLMPVERFKRDSTKSPIWPSAPAMTARARPSARGSAGRYQKCASSAPHAEPTSDPTNPSRVFFGLTAS